MRRSAPSRLGAPRPAEAPGAGREHCRRRRRPFFPLGGAFPRMPKVAENPAVTAAAQSLGCTPSQIGLAWLLHHAPNTLLIPRTADAGHLQANIAAGTIELDGATLAALDATESQSIDVI